MGAAPRRRRATSGAARRSAGPRSAPIRHSGGEYACSVTAGSLPAWLTRWMSAAPNVNDSPALRPSARRARPRGRAAPRAPRRRDRHGAGRQVVVVVAGVVVVHPADQPDRDVLVTMQLGVRARVGPVLDQVRPPLRLARRGRARAARALARVRSLGSRVEDRAAGLTRVIAWRTAGPSATERRAGRRPGGRCRARAGRRRPRAASRRPPSGRRTRRRTTSDRRGRRRPGRRARSAARRAAARRRRASPTRP